MLLTNNPAKLDGLAKAGIEIAGRMPIKTPINSDNRRYLTAKATRAGHQLDHILGALAEPEEGSRGFLTRRRWGRDLLVAGEYGGDGPGDRCEHAPIGIAEVGRHAEHEERHDIDDSGGGHADGEGARGRRSRPPGASTNRDGKDEPKSGPKQQGRLQLVVERNERREIWTVAVGRARIEPIPDRQHQVRAAEELPHEGRAVAEIGEGVRRERMPPCRGQPRRAAEDHVVGALQPPHHKRAGLDVPIGVPADRVVALAESSSAV